MFDLAAMPPNLQTHYEQVQFRIEQKHPRAAGWKKLEMDLIERTPFCCICGESEHRTQLVGHHIAPFHTHRELELVPTNIIIVGNTCTTGQHHLAICHYGDFRKWNPDIRQMARVMLANRQAQQEGFDPVLMFIPSLPAAPFGGI